MWEDATSAHRAFFGKGICPVLTEKEAKLLLEDNDADQSTGTPWRIGVSHERANQLLLRMATDVDVKEKGASHKSKYYKKYGNPNLPQERKRKFGTR